MGGCAAQVQVQRDLHVPPDQVLNMKITDAVHRNRFNGQVILMEGKSRKIEQQHMDIPGCTPSLALLGNPVQSDPVAAFLGTAVGETGFGMIDF